MFRHQTLAKLSELQRLLSAIEKRDASVDTRSYAWQELQKETANTLKQVLDEQRRANDKMLETLQHMSSHNAEQHAKMIALLDRR